MAFKRLDDSLSVSPQLSLGDVARAAREGFRAIISNRPDGEETGQPGGSRRGKERSRTRSGASLAATPGARRAAARPGGRAPRIGVNRLALHRAE